jgi:NAD(P)-dependent dehydrogenase (short-subunit alcohol dehydrogenase family)
MSKFEGKVSVVTGAGSGIGRATALAFPREGASVAVADILEQDNQETARMIMDLGGHALAITCDVAGMMTYGGRWTRPSKPSVAWISHSTMQVSNTPSSPLQR